MVQHNLQAQKAHPTSDILFISWLLESISARHLLPCAPQYTLFATPATLARLANQVDEYGDVLDQESTLGTLKACLEQVGEKHPLHPFATRGRKGKRESNAVDLTQEGPPPPLEGIGSTSNEEQEEEQDEEEEEVLYDSDLEKESSGMRRPKHYLPMIESFEDDTDVAALMSGEFHIFHRCVVFCIDNHLVPDPSVTPRMALPPPSAPEAFATMVDRAVLLGGGRVVHTLQPGITHVISRDTAYRTFHMQRQRQVSKVLGAMRSAQVAREDEEAATEGFGSATKRTRWVAQYYVTPKWVLDSIAKGERLDEKLYLPVYK